MNDSYQSKRVFITGGTGSVGRELVKVFCNRGFIVTFQYSSNTQAAKILMDKFNVESIKIDLSRTFILPETKFNIIINNAGVNISNVISHEISIDDWEKTMAINLTAPFIICKKYLPGMLQEGWGRIINISSIYGLRGTDWNLPYNVSKHGLSGLTKSIAKDYASYGITCNEICPGPINSDMMQRIGEQEAAASGQSVEEYFREYTKQIPAKRFAEPNEIVSLSLFLASSESAYINGASIPIDGGWIA